MGTHPIFESDFDCLTEWETIIRKKREFHRQRNPDIQHKVERPIQHKETHIHHKRKSHQTVTLQLLFCQDNQFNRLIIPISPPIHQHQINLIHPMPLRHHTHPLEHHKLRQRVRIFLMYAIVSLPACSRSEFWLSTSTWNVPSSWCSPSSAFSTRGCWISSYSRTISTRSTSNCQRRFRCGGTIQWQR